MLTRARLFNRNRLLDYLLPALAVTQGLQLLRVFFVSMVWYLRDTVGISALNLAPIALGTFLLGFLAAGLRRLAGPRLALWLTAGGVAVVRLIEQANTEPGFDLWLSIAGFALFILFLSIYLGHLRARGERVAGRWSYGLILGFTLDIALRGAFGAVDLSWIAGPIPLMMVGLISAFTLWSLAREPIPRPEAPSDASWGRTLPLLAIGPYFLLQLLFYESEGFVEVVANLGDPIGFLIVMAGNAIAALGIAWGLSRPRSQQPLLALAIGIYLTLAVATIDQPGGSIVLTILIGQLLMGWGWALLARTAAQPSRTGLTRTMVALAGGMVLFLVLVFGFYLALDIAMPYPRAIVPPASAALLGLLYVAAGLQSRPIASPQPWELSGVSAAGLLVLVPLVYWVISGPAPEPQQPNGSSVKVMTYNIHSSVSMHGRQDPEAIAQVIEASGADIVGLQEVARVRLLDGEADLPVWLSRRLDMPMLFQGTEEPTWGNAILSKFPILESGWGELPREDTLLGRGYLWALIDVGQSQPLLVIDTHLHHEEEESQPRQAQVPVLLEFWGDRPSSILLGDLNAEPDSLEMAMIYEAGLVDSWSEAGSGVGYTYSSRDPHRRIDWIWHSPDLAAAEVEVIQSLASDHQPVLLTLDLSP